MKTLTFAALLLYTQLASSLMIYKPSGEFINIRETGYGYSVYDTEKQTITPVTNTQDGYVIFPQNGEPTFIRMDPDEKRQQQELLLPILIDDETE